MSAWKEGNKDPVSDAAIHLLKTTSKTLSKTGVFRETSALFLGGAFHFF
jgi:hypothetical protein